MNIELVDPSTIPARDSYPIGYPEVDGQAEIRFTELRDYQFFVASLVIGEGTSLAWSQEHGEEALFVLAGEVSVGAVACKTKGSVIVESDAVGSLIAVTESKLLHLGRTPGATPPVGLYGPPAAGMHTMHVLDSNGMRTTNPAPGFEMTHYADAGCATCRVDFFRVRGDGPTKAPSHSHSMDEMITVTEGTLRVGPLSVPAGSTIAVPGNRRYGFRTTGAYEFVNYRPDVSFIFTQPGEPARLEAGVLRSS